MQKNSRPRVLLISDEQRLIDALVTAFASRWPRAQIWTAWDAASGVQMVVDQNPELIILDTDVPDRDATDALADITRSSRAPVVLLTGGGRWSHESRAQVVEANLRLAKPFSTRALIDFAQHALEREDRTRSVRPTFLDPVALASRLQIVVAEAVSRLVRLGEARLTTDRMPRAVLRLVIAVLALGVAAIALLDFAGPTQASEENTLLCEMSPEIISDRLESIGWCIAD